MKRAVVAIVLLAGACAAADLAGIKAETNLEKRSGAALKYADSVLKDARQAYNKGDLPRTKQLVAEFQDSVVLAEDSLKETGKNPRKSPKWFKRAEIRTRELIKKLDAFRQDMDVADRPMLGDARAKIQQVHDDLLRGVMEGKK